MSKNYYIKNRLLKNIALGIFFPGIFVGSTDASFSQAQKHRTAAKPPDMELSLEERSLNEELFQALKESEPDLGKIEQLLAQGANPDARNQYNDTPLFHAKNAEITALLLNAGANADARNDCNNTPLFHAENAAITALLLNAGADVDARNQYNDTPLFHAKNAEITDLLLNAGADVNAQSNLGDTPLHVALYHFQKDPKQIEKLLQRGAKIDVASRSVDHPKGNTPLFIVQWAAQKGLRRLRTSLFPHTPYKLTDDTRIAYAKLLPLFFLPPNLWQNLNSN
ncbi:MAG: ankyrin repeat domain-containing protein [Puniceicoccales bacterium]|jgi:ankyrin repeat protein|nr:ankyrin repeat domain-containing protein [Puniceicoccales bacterium]